MIALGIQRSKLPHVTAGTRLPAKRAHTARVAIAIDLYSVDCKKVRGHEIPGASPATGLTREAGRGRHETTELHARARRARARLPAARRRRAIRVKPIRIIVPFVAGGAVDTLARMMGAKISEQLGQPVIVENRPGAGGNVAADAVAKAPPDGYTILQNTNGQAISPAIYRSLPFDVVRDFIPVTQMVASQLVLAASPKLEATSVAELIALAKAKPGSLNYGMTGVGNPLHLTMEMLKTTAGIDIQAVPVQGRCRDFSRAHHRGDPRRGGADGDQPRACAAGTVRALAVAGAKRSAALPDVPTVAESGVAGFEFDELAGLVRARRHAARGGRT